MLDIFVKIKDFYERSERFNPFVFFFGGFTWDSITLKRIDQLLDNIILLTYLILLGVLIVLTTLVENNKIEKESILKHQKWFPLGLQFFLGGLFSAYVIYYFQSTSFTKTSLFLGILVMLLIANEFLHKRLRNLHLLIAFYFLASFSFFIFFIPVVLKILNVFTFIAGGLLSLLLVLGIIRYLYKKLIFASKKSHLMAGVPVLSLYAIINFFYFFNLIPPVPLSMKFGGIYHHASKNAQDDSFVLKFEKPKWYQFFKSSDKTYHYSEGDTVSCFTAIFAPAKLTKKIFHHWQQYSSNQNKWITTDRLGYHITGYRDGGYRGITRKRNVSRGEWRVNVETEEGVLIGRIGFHIEDVDAKVALKTIYR